LVGWHLSRQVPCLNGVIADPVGILGVDRTKGRAYREALLDNRGAVLRRCAGRLGRDHHGGFKAAIDYAVGKLAEANHRVDGVDRRNPVETPPDDGGKGADLATREGPGGCRSPMRR
jgi:hypothetical protein